MKGDQELILGVDVGGNHVKIGFVDAKGGIHDFQSYSTKEMVETGDFARRLRETIAYKLVAHPEVRRIGIGLPGMINKDRTMPLEITAIPQLNGFPLWQDLHEAFPTCRIEIENDANAAALGEYKFSKELVPENFLFVTLGTGIGSAAVIDGKIFKGGDGNGLELGHIPSRNGKRLEENIGKKGILELGTIRLSEYRGDTAIPRDEPVSATRMVVEANKGDVFSREVFEEVGGILGEGLVAAIRILDLKYVYVGGGLSASFNFVKPAAEAVLRQYLTPYYTDALELRLATLGNDAGLLGAASLCMDN